MRIETHPQRAQIIQMMMDTTNRMSMRQIAATLDPPMNQATLARFRAKLLGHATSTMKGRDAKFTALKDLAAISTGTGVTEQDRQESAARIREELQNAVQNEQKLIDRYRLDAEAAQEVHPITGEVSHNMDHASLAKHTRNKLSTLELRAKLSGLLQDSSTGAATIRAVVMMPAPGDPAAAQPAEPGRLAVEIDLKR